MLLVQSNFVNSYCPDTEAKLGQCLRGWPQLGEKNSMGFPDFFPEPRLYFSRGYRNKIKSITSSQSQ